MKDSKFVIAFGFSSVMSGARGACGVCKSACTEIGKAATFQRARVEVTKYEVWEMREATVFVSFLSCFLTFLFRFYFVF